MSKTSHDQTNLTETLEELRKSKEKHESILKGALDGFFIADQKGKIVEVNDAYSKMSGYSKKELLKMSIKDLEADESKDEVKKHIKKIMTKGFDAFNSKHVKKDGSHMALDISVRYLGEGLLAVFMKDITESEKIKQEQLDNLQFLKNMEKINKIIRKENDLERMMTKVLDAVLSIFDCDRAFLMYPCDPKADIWSAPMERTKPGYPGLFELGLEMKMDSQVAKTLNILLAAEGPVQFGPGTPNRLPKNVSEQFGIKSFMSMVLRPKTGCPWQFGIHQCSYARKWTKNELMLFQEIGLRLSDSLTNLLNYRDLEQSEERFRQVTAHAQEWIWETDSEGLYTYSSHVVKKVLGYDPKEIVGKKHFYDLFHPEIKEELKKTALRIFSQKEVFREFQNLNKHKNGQKVLLLTNGGPILDKKGKLLGYRGVDVDITKKRASRETELRYRYLFDYTNNCVAIYKTPDGKNFIFTDYNKAAEKADQIKKEQVVGKNIEDLFPGVRKFGLLEVFQRVWKTGKAEHFPLTFYQDERISGWRDNYVFKLKTGELVAIYRDATKEKQAEEALQQSDQRFRQVMAHAQEWIWETDSKGLYTYSSHVVKKILGYDPKEIVGKKHFYDFFHPESKNELKRAALQEFAKKKSFRAFPNLNIHKNGRKVWLSTTASPVLDKKGKLLGYRGMDVDITERKEAEVKLKESEKNLYDTNVRLKNLLRFNEVLLADIPIPIFYKDSKGLYIGCNQAFTEMMGVTSEQIKGKTVMQLWPSKLAKKYHQKDLELIKNEGKQEYEFMVKDKNGVDRPVIYNKAVFYDEKGKVAGIIGTFQDLTTYKEVEARVQKINELRKKFVTVIAHQMRTPLAASRWNLERLIEGDAGKVDEAQRVILKTSLNSTTEIIKRIGELLELMDIEEQRISISREITDLRELAQSVVQEHLKGAESKQIKLSLRPVSANLPRIDVDSQKIRRVMDQFVSNAISYTPEKGKITCNLKIKDDVVRYEVTDTGIGIPREEQDKIFNQFFRASNAMRTITDASGIGLSIAKYYVEKHNGTIGFTSNLNKGSTFWFELPLAQSNH